MTGFVCPDCGREVTAEIVELGRIQGMIKDAAEAEEGFYPVGETSVTVRFGCSCDHVDVEYDVGSTSAWDVPDVWTQAFQEVDA